MINAGHGSGYLRTMTRLLLDNGASGVVIDPEPDNDRARRAYHKAGFVRVEKRTTSESPAIVMHFVRKRTRPNQLTCNRDHCATCTGIILPIIDFFYP